MLRRFTSIWRAMFPLSSEQLLQRLVEAEGARGLKGFRILIRELRERGEAVYRVDYEAEEDDGGIVRARDVFDGAALRQTLRAAEGDIPSDFERVLERRVRERVDAVRCRLGERGVVVEVNDDTVGP